MRSGTIPFFLMASFAMIAGCAAPHDDHLPLPAAPTFDVITDEQLHSAMWQLADGVARIQGILGTGESVTPSRRNEVLLILDQMIAAANALGPEPASATHAQITHNLPGFRERLSIARNSAAMDPPRYFLVGNLAGTCHACHAR